MKKKRDKSREARRETETVQKSLERRAVLSVIGLARAEVVPPVDYDVAREHDRWFADLEDARTTDGR